MDGWNEDLAKDIHDALKHKENNLAKIHGNSQFIYWRRYLVDWLALTCQKFNLNSNAQHLAVCLYDRFTDRFTLRVHDLSLLVICCLLIACKFEEREERIPKFTVLMDHLQWHLVASDYLQLELKILSAFSWNIGFPTATHFKDYYMKVAISDSEQHLNREEALVYVEKNVNYFLEVSLQDVAFLNFKPSLIMASCIASARICLGLSPTWTVQLHKQTYFGWSQIQPCIEILLRLHDEDRKAMQESAKNMHHRQPGMSLNSVGNSPVTSPISAIDGYSYSAMVV